MKSEVPDDDQPYSVRRAFADKILATVLEAIGLSADLVKFSYKELQALEDYLYANELMVQCKNAALSLSRDTWQQIEDRMLLPPD